MSDEVKTPVALTHSTGRPTLKTEQLVSKLEEIFKIGGNIEEAVSYAGISRETYYRWLRDDESFVTKMEAAQHFADVAAKHLVVKAIKDNDLNTAKWWLEKRQPSNTTVNVQVNNVIEKERKEYNLNE